MKRNEAVALLKELSVSKLIEPSWVSINQDQDDFSLKLKVPQCEPILKEYCNTNNLFLAEKDGYLFISNKNRNSLSVSIGPRSTANP
jgi:hypothetical protein